MVSFFANLSATVTPNPVIVIYIIPSYNCVSILKPKNKFEKNATVQHMKAKNVTTLLLLIPSSFTLD